MLEAFRMTYGYVPFEPEEPRGRRLNRNTEQNRHLDQRPRTESLIQDEDPAEEFTGDEPDQTNRDKRNLKETSGISSRPEDRARRSQAVTTTPRSSTPTAREALPTIKSKKRKELPAKSLSGTEEEDLSDPEKEIVFVDDQELSNNNLLKLSNSFHQRMTNLTAFVPLTVFNADWIERDVEKAGLKKLKSVKELQEGDDIPTYSGLTPRDELLLTCAIVVDIRRTTSCWMIALRYCIKVRKLVMQNRLGWDKKRQMSNAGILHNDILRAAKDKAEALGERAYQENPYASSSGEPEQTSSRDRNSFKRDLPGLFNDNNHWKSSGSRRNNKNKNNHSQRNENNINNNNNAKRMPWYKDNNNWRDNNNHNAYHSNQQPHRSQNNNNFQQGGGFYGANFPSYGMPPNGYGFGTHQPSPYGTGTYGSAYTPSYTHGSSTHASEPQNQLTVVSKPGGNNQGGALAIVNRQSGGNKQNW
ncbi:uncharacterized protein MELLADRAFT_89317 [Melampsora larici-populina 98AG31]|uniref:Uncharacterized protein n=1 Tax=Melampsora larici-populina (strain 98AG31 / pathotype 3-4-7) TaxID=747676 RepID=F4R5Q3_MELLP|nr:uncharacterized protein MELLADRAFT_89317 [Melampsora larici-populina 98AG31]EGG12221.1 hypothetical protein MELLADRAFT_89317 [Melampsora larici-populina 98AG31]